MSCVDPSPRTLDWIGTVLCVAFSTCLLLGLEWGGSVHPWNSVAVIVPLCIFGVLAISFIVWEWHRGLHALVPFEYFKRRTQSGACLEGVRLLLRPYSRNDLPSHPVLFIDSAYCVNRKWLMIVVQPPHLFLAVLSTLMVSITSFERSFS
jgi:hypothetical protein